MRRTFEITYNCGFHCVKDIASGEILFRCADKLSAYIYAAGLYEGRIEALQEQVKRRAA